MPMHHNEVGVLVAAPLHDALQGETRGKRGLLHSTRWQDEASGTRKVWPKLLSLDKTDASKLLAASLLRACSDREGGACVSGLESEGLEFSLGLGALIIRAVL